MRSSFWGITPQKDERIASALIEDALTAARRQTQG
jgi:hypothetical protein